MELLPNESTDNGGVIEEFRDDAPKGRKRKDTNVYKQTFVSFVFLWLTKVAR